MRQKTFTVITLGCRSNLYESAVYEEQLLGLGYQKSDKDADICIINSCTVTAQADTKSMQALRKMRRQHPKAKIAMTGCMAKKAKDAIQAVDPAVLVVPNKEKEQLVAKLFPHLEALPEFALHGVNPGRTRALLKIQDGCNSFCTYCIIPYVRGKSRSRSIEDIVKEAQALVDGGYKEIVLTGINIGDFEEGLAPLIRRLDAVSGDFRVRLSSIDPDEVTDELMDAILESRCGCPWLHIVLQSGSNVILKKMRRKYTRQDFFTAIEKLRRRCSDFCFSTDVIVGFPGETKEDFEETKAVVKETQFLKLHIFPYSRREGTWAAKRYCAEEIDSHTLTERKNELLALGDEISFLERSRFLGRQLQVVVEGDGIGHSPQFLEIRLKNAPKVGSFAHVLVEQNTKEGLEGLCL